MGHFESLQSEGYTVVRAAVPPELCERAVNDVSTIKAKHKDIVRANSDEFGHLYRVVNLHLAIDSLVSTFTNSGSALAACDQFFGRSTSLYTTLYYERGSEQDLHRDTPYFSTKPAGNYLGVWLALDDVDDGNGPLRVTPGSHKLPPVDVRAMARKLAPSPGEIPSNSVDGWDMYQGEVQRQAKEFGLTTRNVHVNRGDIIIWHPELLHGGAPHLEKARSRRSLVMHVTPVGVPVYHMDVFFNPDAPVSDKAPWTYLNVDGRKIANFDQVDFGHQYSVPAQSLR